MRSHPDHGTGLPEFIVERLCSQHEAGVAGSIFDCGLILQFKGNLFTHRPIQLMQRKSFPLPRIQKIPLTILGHRASLDNLPVAGFILTLG